MLYQEQMLISMSVVNCHKTSHVLVPHNSYSQLCLQIHGSMKTILKLYISTHYHYYHENIYTTLALL